MRVALDYLTEFIDPAHREEFIKAERAARTEEEMNRLLVAARRYIAQRTLIEILDIDATSFFVSRQEAAAIYLPVSQAHFSPKGWSHWTRPRLARRCSGGRPRSLQPQRPRGPLGPGTSLKPLRSTGESWRTCRRPCRRYSLSWKHLSWYEAVRHVS